MPDSWEIDYFGNLLQEDYNDYDGDGISNLEEYREGTDPTVSNKKTGSLLWLWATLGIILLGAIIFFVFKLLKKPKSRGGIIDPRLKSYVQSSLRKGFTKNQIKQALITKGWSQSDINKVLK